MKVCINLLNYKSYQMGGVESYIKNVIKLLNENKNERITLIYIVNKYAYKRFINLIKQNEVYIYDFNPDNIISSVLWQKRNLKKIIKKLKIDILFSPQTILPIKLDNITTISVFHDVRFKDLPNNFPLIKKLWLEYIYRITLKNTDVILTISNYTKNRLKKYFDCGKKRIVVIYNSIYINKKIDKEKEKEVLNYYNLESKDYYYTICSTHKHKNLKTLIELYNKTKEKLIITGPKRDQFNNLYHLKKENVILTGYINEVEKNILLKNCKLFLFPSTYEGFGMPIIEAFMHGKNVVTTKKAAIPEISFNKATYVEDPFDINEWHKKIDIALKNKENLELENFFNRQYNDKAISKEYLALLLSIGDGINE
ncbi:MAG: glycosyltransferase family 4 protein [archaeon]